MPDLKDFVQQVEAVQDYLPDLFTRLREDPKLRDDPDLWFHFTSVPKLGVNPRPSHRDPYGIYLFPKRWVVSQEIGRNSSFTNQPYVFVLKMKPGMRVLDLDAMTKEQAAEILTTMGLQDQIALLDAPPLRDSTHFGQIFWQILDHHIQPMKGRNGAWNGFFRKAGIDAVIDPGISAIHPNEPEQALVFNARNLEIVEIINNRPGRGRASVARDLLTKFGEAIFGAGNFRFSERSTKQTERTYLVTGTYKEHKFSLYTTIYDPREVREFSGNLYLAPTWHTKEYLSEKIEIRLPYQTTGYYADKTIEGQVGEYSPGLIAFMDRAIERAGDQDVDRSGKLAEIAGQLFPYFGIGKVPTIRAGQAEIEERRVFDWGSFSVRVGYSHYTSAWDSTLLIYTTNRSEQAPREAWGKKMNSGVFNEEPKYPDDMPPGEMARQMVVDMIESLEHNIYKYFNPDASSYRDNDSLKYGYADNGRNLLRVLYRVRALPRIRLLLPLPHDPDDPHKEELHQVRMEIDLKGIVRIFERRYPMLGKLKRPIRFDPNIKSTAGFVPETQVVRVGRDFFHLPVEERDYILGRSIGLSILSWEVPESFVRKYLPDGAELPWDGSLAQNFAKAFADHFILGDSLEDHPGWLKAVQGTYMKAMSYASSSG